MNSHFREFLKRLVEIDNAKEMAEFLDAILTPQELKSIPRRLQIIRMIKKGIPQREISKKLGVGIATVTRGSKEIKSKHFKNV